MVMLLKKILWRPWIIGSITQGVHLTLAPLRSLSDRLEPIERLESEQEILLLPAPSPPKRDLNRATVEELRQVEGVGFVRALEIVEYRERYGDYRRLEELGMIPGVGSKTFQLIAERFEVRAHP
jgi:competence ComEA-like helix-hairpin-helix protein